METYLKRLLNPTEVDFIKHKVNVNKHTRLSLPSELEEFQEYCFLFASSQ